MEQEKEAQTIDESPVIDEQQDNQQDESGGLGDFTEATDSDQQAAEQTRAEINAAEPKKTEWDTERQRADQAEANFRKLQREKQEIESRYQETAKKAEELEAKMAEFAKANDVNLDELESEFVDPTAYRVIKSMKDKLSSLEKLASDYKKAEQDRQRIEQERHIEQAKEQAKSEILADIESEFSPQFRNDALKMANEICEKRGYAPQDRYEASKILRQCYKDIASKKKTTAKPDVPFDTGKATTTASPKTGEVKPGTLREVAAQMRAKLKI